MHRRRSGWLLASVVLALALGPQAAARPAARSSGVEPLVILVEQTPVVTDGGSFAVRFGLEGVPDDGSLQVVVHQRVRSRSELALSMDGEGLRSEVLRTVAPLDGLPADAAGVRELTLSLDPDTGVLPISTEGVYPVELIAQDAATAPLARLVTHLVLGPDDADDAPSLGVAVVASVRARPALQPDGSVSLTTSRTAELAALAEGLAGSAAPATLDVGGETLDALRSDTSGPGAAAVAALTAAARGRTVLAGPYVEVSVDGLADVDLLGELGPQLEVGLAALRSLAPSPTRTVALAPSDLGRDGLDGLVYSGVRTLVVDPDQVEPLDPGVISYSMAQPFVLTAPDGASATALATDPQLDERLATEGSAGLMVSRVLSELALLRLEQPSVARSAVLVLEPGLSAEAVTLLLDGLDAGRPFEPLPLDQAADHAEPLLDGGGNPVELALLPSDPRALPQDVADSLRVARRSLTTFAGLVGDAPDVLDPLARHLLVAQATGEPTATRRAHVQRVIDTITGVSAQVTTPATFTLTLTARDGTIPLTIGNGTGLPLHVTVHLRSQKLEFPDGETIDLVLSEPNTRLDIPVRALASGAFPLRIDITTPDGLQRLSMSRFTVRSTAVSGVGLVLSIGAGAFLVVWWARHWHRTRRSAKLVASGADRAKGA